ncbi:MAG: cysteine synthase A [Gammaproteobacteria bacterium]|nr:cysteine synthase A [Gammaproteobacteria bacterium]
MMNAQHQLVYCPRQSPTCLVTSEVCDSIGHTPLIRLRDASKQTGCNIFAKAEFMNPGGSIKDRIARHIVFEAEKRGELEQGSTIMEVTSGNTGIALAMIGAMRGYKVVIVMPKTVSIERREMITFFGAKLEPLEDIDEMQAAIVRTEAFASSHDKVFLPRQFANPDNIEIHRTTTGPEILRQLKGEIDAFVMGVGTGGTVMGVGRALRKAGSRARIVAVEPDESAMMSGEAPGDHGIQGLADGFIPALVNLDEIDQIVRVPTQLAIDAAQQIGIEEGLLVGISSGANVLATLQVAHELGPGHNIVTVLCDRGERYLSAAERRLH